MKRILVLTALAAALSASAAVPTATVDAAVQDGRQRLTVNWTLSGAPGYVTLDVLTNGVSVGGAALGGVTGDVNGLFEPGSYSFTWNARRSGIERRDYADGDVKVVLTAHGRADAPLYCVADLATGRLRYYESEDLLPNGPLRRSGTAAELLADPYRTSLLVLRRIPALGLPFQVGESGGATAFRAVLSHDYYMAVYEMTQAQQKLLTGGTSSRDTEKALSPVKPVDCINSFSDVRGDAWPDGGHGTVAANSPVDRLRTLTGAAFDLPTQAEWEFAARGARTTAGDYGETNDVSRIDACAWHVGNSGGETQPVGLKEPNLFGLYDIYGNVAEWVLDRSTGDYGVTDRTAPVVDPTGGAQSVTGHVKKGGSYKSEATAARATHVWQGNWDNYANVSGYRLCLPVGGAETAAPDGVDFHQDAASKIVTVRYSLDEEAVVTLDVLTNGVSIGAANVKYAWGDVNRLLQPGDRELKWPAAKSWSGFGERTDVTVRVVKWPRASPPDYAVTALGPGLSGHTAYFADAEQIPLGLSDALYKSEMLVLKRVRAAGRVWTVGSPTTEANHNSNERQHRVTFSEDYYLGVYETTQRQYQRALDLADGNVPSFEVRYGTRDDWALLPMNSNSIWNASTALRGTTDWPNSGHEVTAASPLGKFRARTGFAFDLPTEAQWEVACRAGSQTAWGCPEDELSDCAWWSSNSGGVLHEVGTRRPNAWGFYDMMGNVAEYCLQWLDKGVTDTYGLTEEQLRGVAIDPTGVASGDCKSATRINRGGTCTVTDKKNLRAALRGQGNNGSSTQGFRLCAPAYAQ